MAAPLELVLELSIQFLDDGFVTPETDGIFNTMETDDDMGVFGRGKANYCLARKVICCWPGWTIVGDAGKRR